MKGTDIREIISEEKQVQRHVIDLPPENYTIG